MYLAHNKETDMDYLEPLIVSCPIVKFVANCFSVIMETHILMYPASHSFLSGVYEIVLSLSSIICGRSLI